MLAPKDPVPREILQRIGELYRIEEEARSQGLSWEQRLERRRESSVPVVEALEQRIREIQQHTPPGSQLAKACQYALGQWKRLQVFLQDGRIEIDTNLCENSIRPLALGRRNWLHIGSVDAGPKVAAIASIAETCHRLNINLRQYLRVVLPKLPEWPVNRVSELTPLAWQKSRPS